MPSPFSQKSNPPANVRPVPADPAERILDRRQRERRSWAARSFTSLLIFGLVVIGFILVRRDRGVREQYMTSLRAYVSVLNARLEAQREQKWDRLLLPAQWDVSRAAVSAPVPFDLFRRYDARLRDYAQENSDRPTMIAWTNSPVPMMLGPDGRPVAIYQDGKVRVEWLPELEFSRRLADQEERIEKALKAADERPLNLR